MTCGHVTLRSPQQPCPHPDCWTSGHRLHMPRPVHDSSFGAEPAVIREDVFEPGRLALGNETFYAWKACE